jgi:hypothetical protein
MSKELDQLREENTRMRNALIAILRTGPIHGGQGGVTGGYKRLYVMHLREAVRALGLSKLYDVAWQQALERGWAKE